MPFPLAQLTEFLTRPFRPAAAASCPHPALTFDTYREVVIAHCARCNEVWISDAHGVINLGANEVGHAP